jgi:hypothetical protein
MVFILVLIIFTCMLVYLNLRNGYLIRRLDKKLNQFIYEQKKQARKAEEAEAVADGND